MPRALATAVLVLLAAGCVAPGAGSPDAGSPPPAGDVAWAARALPYGEGHDHRDWSQHVGLTTPNFEVLAYDPLEVDGASPGGYFCGGTAVTSEGRKLAVVSSLDTDVAFVLVDVTDPAKPEKIGEYYVEGATHYDVDITSDGGHVLIGTNVKPDTVTDLLPDVGLPIAAPPLVRPMWRDACTGELREAGPEQQLPLAPALLLVSIADPTDPVLEDVFPAPVFGVHSVSTETIEGVEYVAASITNAMQAVDYFYFFQISELPTGGARLELLSAVDGSQYAAQGTPVNNFGGHVEAELTIHPATGTFVAYLSNWDGGLVILDMTDPRLPTFLGTWLDTGVEGGAVHATRSVPELWDGKHYVLVGQEFTHHPENRPSGWVYVIDDTDPTAPVEVGRWTLPVDAEPEGWPQSLELFSTHYIDVIERTMFVAMYHGGVWAVDLSDEARFAEPKSIGAFVPDRAPPNGREPTGFYDYAPFVLDLFPGENSTLTVTDGLSGLYSVRFDASRPMASPTPWPAAGLEPGEGPG